MADGSRRKARYAGSFYPDDAGTLRRMIESYVNNAPESADAGHLSGIVSPHAGYVYSGPVAGYGYRALMSVSLPKTVFLLGSSHHVGFEGIALSSHRNWETPMGSVPVSDIGNKMCSEETMCSVYDDAHDIEHSLEVQLPFLQHCYGKKDFEIVPMLVSDVSYEEVARVLDHFITKGDLLVVSTDLSHYLPYADAKAADAITVEALENMDVERMVRDGDACGIVPVLAALELGRRRGWKVAGVYYKNSGDTEGTKDAVVGYVSAIFTERI